MRHNGWGYISLVADSCELCGLITGEDELNSTMGSDNVVGEGIATPFNNNFFQMWACWPRKRHSRGPVAKWTSRHKHQLVARYG